MSDVLSFLSSMKRPKLLIRAAQHGQQTYKRTRDLRRILKGHSVPKPNEAIRRLREEEHLLNMARADQQEDYNPRQHVDVLIALLAEAMLLGAGSNRQKLTD